jgi:hypothetical protein
MAARIKLGELLVRAGVLDEFKLKAALAEQQRWGGRLGRILIEMNFVPEDLLVKALSKQLGVARARLDKPEIPADVLSRIDPQFAAQNAICPERYLADKKTLVVAMADPTNVGAIDELRFKTGLRIETSLAGELEIAQAIDRVFYGRAPIEGIDISMIERSGGTPMVFEDSNDPPSSQLPTIPPPSQARTQPMSSVQMQPFSMPPTQQMQAMQTMPPLPPPLSTPAMSTQPLPTPPPPQTGGSSFSAQSPLLHTPRMTPPPLPPSRAPSTPSTVALEMATQLDGAQKKQLKAMRVLLELLIEKGVFSRDEYMALVNRR